MPESNTEANNANEPQSFPRKFLPELRAEITSYLPGKDLKSYSLACRAFHADATSYLWSNAEVRWSHPTVLGYKDPDEFFRLMSQYPDRARRLKSLSLHYIEVTFEDKPSDNTVWSPIVEALSLMNNLQRLDFSVRWRWIKDQRRTELAPEALYTAFASAVFKTTLSYLSIDAPADPRGVDQLARLFPDLSALVCYDTLDDHKRYTSPDPNSLLHLQYTYGNLNLLEVLPGEAKVETFKLLQSCRLNILRAGKLGDAARGVRSLKHLNFNLHVPHRADYTDNSPGLLPVLAHPKLVSLTLEISHSYAQRDSYPSAHVVLSNTFIFGILSGNGLTYVPSLRYLHISHRNDLIFQAVLKNLPRLDTTVEPDSKYELDENKIQLGLEALEKCLAAESMHSHPLQELWIDCSVEDLVPTVISPRLRFSAQRSGFRVDWSVQARMVWCSEDMDGQLGADFRYTR
ncbi:hypothetical protein DL93DRAFT_2234595 [Clavulina sp. PMI_390]|nr:hypothetical protein DL93DRAFT_2234595 [Clavulina sp. PMI_390]